MNRILAPLVAGLLLAIVSPAFAQSSLILSELCDPRLNYREDRFIEITNVGNSSQDLTGWSIVAVGNTVVIHTWNLSGSIAPGQSLVAADATTIDTFQVDFPDESWSVNNSTWNGKIGDGARLYNGATLIDEFVAPGSNFENDDMFRHADILAGSTTTQTSQWTAVPRDLASDATPGSHTYNGAITPPTIGALSTLPALPAEGDSVRIRAELSDANHTLTTASVNWGAGGSLPNTIAMADIGGGIWESVSPIPPQPAGSTVEYEVVANNDAGGLATSAVQNYGVPRLLGIAAIQGASGNSPYITETVVTHGTVTAVVGGFFTVQEGNGAREGLWARSTPLPAPGDSIRLRGTVLEGDGAALNATTLLDNAIIEWTMTPSAVPAAVVLGSGSAATEDWEGLVVAVAGDCTDVGPSPWRLNDGSGSIAVGDLAVGYNPTFGSTYSVLAPLGDSGLDYVLEPVLAGDIVFVADNAAPQIASVGTPNSTTVDVEFSEPVDAVSAENAANYSIAGISVLSAAFDGGSNSIVVLTVSEMATDNYVLQTNNIADLAGNISGNLSAPFSYDGGNIPPGYYDSADGQTGTSLQSALHGIINGHTVFSYASIWETIKQTDAKPNGKVWCIYSDVPGGTSAYEYTFDVDKPGSGAGEGSGYNREHTWPKSWYGGDVSPMFTDLHVVFPTDAYMNGQRSNLPYGETTSPTNIYSNGTEKGPSSWPGYTGTVFEPIDEYKGDLARVYFYMGSRYFGQDGAWPGSPMTSGAQLLPWALDMLYQWHLDDPVSEKERSRNDAVFANQGNRNPFVDRSYYAQLVYFPATPTPSLEGEFAALLPNSPNPFNPATELRWMQPRSGEVSLGIYDVAGRLVDMPLVRVYREAGEHALPWKAVDNAGRALASGVYYYRLRMGDQIDQRRMVLLK